MPNKTDIKLKNAKLLNPRTKNSLVLGNIAIDVKDVQTNVLRSVYNTSIKPDNSGLMFALFVPAKEISKEIEVVLRERHNQL